MDINNRLFVEIVSLQTGVIPRPHPVEDARFDAGLIYKVLGMYNASETSECYFILANPQRQIWFIPQRHLRAFALLDSDEFFISKDHAKQPGHNGQTSNSIPAVEPRPPMRAADRWGNGASARPDQPVHFGSQPPFVSLEVSELETAISLGNSAAIFVKHGCARQRASQYLLLEKSPSRRCMMACQ